MRRANGTGSISDLGPRRRRRYAVRISYQDRPGHWKQKYLSYHSTIREAQAALEAYLQSGVESQTAGVTWGQVYESWSERKYRKVSTSAASAYKAAWNRLSVYAGREMQSITIDDLQRIIDADEEAELSQSSINNDRMLMRALYKHAMERDIVAKDYSSFVEVPTVGPKYAKGILTEEQIERLHELAGAGDMGAGAVLLLVYTGFRISELLTLTRESWHPEGQYLIGGLKTDAGKDRTVPVHHRVLPYLLSWLERDGDRIICRSDGKRYQYNNFVKYVFDPVLQTAGISGATPHWCRHTAASRLRVAGADPLAVRRILGHADASITDHYTHVDVKFLARELNKVP